MTAFWSVPGRNDLSPDFCNRAVRIDQQWNDEPIAALLLCGRNAGHDGECDEYPDPEETP
jgi:hypothetical protein